MNTLRPTPDMIPIEFQYHNLICSITGPQDRGRLTAFLNKWYPSTAEWLSTLPDDVFMLHIYMLRLNLPGMSDTDRKFAQLALDMRGITEWVDISDLRALALARMKWKTVTCDTKIHHTATLNIELTDTIEGAREGARFKAIKPRFETLIWSHNGVRRYQMTCAYVRKLDYLIIFEALRWHVNLELR